MKKSFRLLIAALMLICICTGAKAQEKYEYMTINYVPRYKMTISIDGVQLLQHKVVLKKDEDDDMNANPFLSKVKEYESKGWEIMSMYTAVSGASSQNFAYIAYLKKKKS